MMIKHIDFESEIVELVVPGGGSVFLKGFANPDGIPCDIEVYAFGHKFLLKQFASCRLKQWSRAKTNLFVPLLDCALGDETSRFVVVVGLRSVFVVNFAQEKASEALQLFRKPEDDQGFYRLELFPWRDGLLTLYESGTFLLDCEGNVVWHQRLDWGDVLVRHDDEKLYFVGEADEETYEWTITISDGTRGGQI